MKSIFMVVAMLAFTTNICSADQLSGEVVMHSRDSKLIGVKTATGLSVIKYGPKMSTKGIPSAQDLRVGDIVDVDYNLIDKSRLINTVTLTTAGDPRKFAFAASPTIKLQEFNKLVTEKAAVVIDIRGTDEFKAAHLADAVNLPLEEMELRLAEIPKDKTVVLYCMTGRRSNLATTLLKEKGIQVTSVKGKFVVKDGKAQLVD